ncbi:MAG: FecR domain-containing protein [Tannerella sp.]|jgi:ferric-dicitrate binding protein FerR (iron transport regulator)|nr:FecR domain-containing protein [Tannerella sp.]
MTKQNYKDYKDFLQDDRFIFWRLTDDCDLKEEWDAFIVHHPALKQEFEKALREFSKIRLNKDDLSDVEYACLQQRIRKSVSLAERKKRRLRMVQYAAAAACIALLAGFSIYFLNSVPEETGSTFHELIVGENLEEKDIFLVTGSGTMSFSKDIYVQIDKTGSATVREADGGKSTQLAADHAMMNKIVVPYGKRSQLELSDGTKVWINSGSALEFPATFTGKSRTVHLAGEMYVEVAKEEQRPFLIQTSGLRIKVYGTKFNVSAYQDQDAPQSVVLVEGSVGVKTASQAETFLVPNEMLTYHNAQVAKKQVNVSAYVSWKDGYLVLQQTPIADVLKQMERYYNLSFDIQNYIDLQAKTCTGKIYLSDDLDNVMATISLLSSTKYTRDDKKIYIDTNPLK